jgi:hypothetical protein
VAAAEIYRAAVLNRAKLTYDGVSAWLDGAAPPPRRSRVPDWKRSCACTTRWPAAAAWRTRAARST